LYGKTCSKTLNAGLAAALVSQLTGLSAKNRPVRLGQVFVYSFRQNDLTRAFRALIDENRSNLKVFLGHRVCSATKQKGRIIAVQAAAEGRTLSIFPKVVVDASGEGAIIKLCGAKYRVRPRQQRQLAGFSFRVAGIQGDNALIAIKTPYYIKLATFTPLEEAGEGVIRLNVPAGADTLEMRKQAVRQLRHLAEAAPEFKSARIAELSSSVVEREGIRLQGEYTLTADDVLSARRFKDRAVKSSWPIELWDKKKGPQYKYPPAGMYYEIPIRCLKSINVGNLLACGRCISATHEALASVRVAGTCISLGEQAGLTAVKLCESY
jgi:hypothetical protein